MFTAISSAQNPRIKNLVRLRDARHRKRQERFLIDGTREVERALQSDWPLEALFFCSEFFRDESVHGLVEACDRKGIEAVQLSPDAFRKASYREGPDGILALAISRPLQLEDIRLSACPLLLVVEMVEKPGNLGALMRTAAAAGADALIVCDPVCDLYNPNTIRASQGSFFAIPFTAVDTPKARLWMEDRGIRPIAMTPETESTLWTYDLRQASALVVGAEDAGLSADWLEGTVGKARLPMAGITDSLNVSVAAGIALFEAVRQRS